MKVGETGVHPLVNIPPGVDGSDGLGELKAGAVIRTWKPDRIKSVASGTQEVRARRRSSISDSGNVRLEFRSRADGAGHWERGGVAMVA